MIAQYWLCHVVYFSLRSRMLHYKQRCLHWLPGCNILYINADHRMVQQMGHLVLLYLWSGPLVLIKLQWLRGNECWVRIEPGSPSAEIDLIPLDQSWRIELLHDNMCTQGIYKYQIRQWARIVHVLGTHRTRIVHASYTYWARIEDILSTHRTRIEHVSYT